MAKSGTVPFYNEAISQSARFGGNNYLTNELDAPSDNQNFTISTWFKRSKLGAEEGLWAVDATGSYCRFETSGAIRVRQYNGIINAITDGFFRDPSAWYHLVVAWDMDNSTEADRIIIYVNGVRQTLATYHAPTTSETSNINADGRTLHIGSSYSSGATQYFEGYMADFNFVDGSVLAPASFGETKNGVWIPITPTGLTYGNNGFRLQFAQSGVGTASTSTIGADTSGKARHFTSSGIVASDCAMPDSPENNFATINSLMRANITLSEGNLKMVGVDQNTDNQIGTIAFDTNDSEGWYWEYRSIGNDAGTMIGICDTNNAKLNNHDPGPPAANVADGFGYRGDGVKENNNSQVSYGNSWAAGDIISVAIKSGSLFFYKNGTIQNSGTAAYTSISGEKVPFFAINGTQSGTVNFGHDSSFAGTETAQGNTDGNGIGDFYYAPPTGYKALCTSNLPEPTIGANSATQADDYFNTAIYTGNGGTKDITVGFQPDFSWYKCRAGGANRWHYLFDSNRGANKALYSNLTDAEDNQTPTYNTQSFQSNGTRIVRDNGDHLNFDGDTYVSWNWKANGGTTTTNDASATSIGSIDSVIQANTTAGFSIVTYTGTGSAGSIAHGLGAVPKMIITKTRSNSGDWMVYHGANTSAPQTDFLKLNATNATEDLNTVWNDTAPTSSVFTLGSNGDVNTSGRTQVAYCFAEVEGYSKFGVYTGNGNADGTFVYTGFRPAFIMWKRTDSSGSSWGIVDSARNTYNVMGQTLYPDLGNVENTNNYCDFTANGFKIRGTSGFQNASGGTYIYMAFAEASFKYANAR